MDPINDMTEYELSQFLGIVPQIGQHVRTQGHKGRIGGGQQGEFVTVDPHQSDGLAEFRKNGKVLVKKVSQRHDIQFHVPGL